MLSKYKRIGIIGIIILAFFVFIANCKSNVINLLGGYTDQDFITKVDTHYLPIKIDTVAVFNHYVNTKGIILNPDPEIVYKYKTIIKKDTVVIDSTKYFNVAVKDSLIEGKIHIFNDYKGNLLDAYINYKPLFPKYIEITKPIKITETKYVVRNKVMLGFGVGMNTLGHVSGHASFMTKDSWDLRAGIANGTIIPNSFQTDTYFKVEITKYFKW